MRALGLSIRHIRRINELSQEDVAYDAGLHPNQVGRLERGTADVYTSTLMRVCDGLGVPLSAVIAEYEAHLRGERKPKKRGRGH